jgi:outer membrane immunogenic protein
LNQTLCVKTKKQKTQGFVVPVRKYLPCVFAAVCLSVAPAFAADMSATPWLSPAPESAPPAFGDPFGDFGMRSATNDVDWRGFYIGGQFSYSDGNADFSQSTQAPIAYSLRNTTLENTFAPSNWQVLSTANHSAAGFGGFVGYNTVYFAPTAKIVLGVEANYDQASLSLIAPNSPLTRVTPDGSNTVSITGSGSVTDLDFGTLRARAGWAAGNFLPYGFAGFALGQGNVNIAETTTVVQKSPPGTFVFPGAAGKNNEWLYGFTVGGGLDYALTHRIFVRGEYEYVQFQPVAGVDINVNTVRAGAGIKF